MRQKIAIICAAVAGVILLWNLRTILLVEPDELNQGAIYRIIYFHVPTILAGFTGFFLSLCASIGYLMKRDLAWDGFAASVTEVGLAFATVVLVTGSIWARIIWGIWWTWDARLTSMLICWILYASYVMLRRAVDEPTQRARLSAALSIFAFADVIIVWKSIEWWRTQHPGPVLSIRNGGGMGAGMEAPIWWNFLAFLLLGAALVIIRMRQEQVQHEIDALRRYAHAL